MRACDGSQKVVGSTRISQADRLRRAIEWCFDDLMFEKLRVHGNVNWSARLLVGLAILTAWGEHRRLTESFSEAAQLSQRLFGRVTIRTYQGMTRALAVYSDQLLPIVWDRLQSLMGQVSKEHFRIGPWLPLAVDGSRFTTPRTQANEQAFAARNFGKGGRAKYRSKWKNKKRRSKKLCHPVKPQIWLTLIWHMGTKLPWCWKTGPSTACERHHFSEMIDTRNFPENTLFCCDAGFTGYPLWSAIIQHGHHFLIRVGGNVRLLRNLGHACNRDGIVFLWPDKEARRRQTPIMLRLIKVSGKQGTIYLVTNVLNQSKLSDAMIKRLYPLRWGVEIQFRSLKQTFGVGQLRSRNSDYALAELHWSIVALTVVQLLSLKEQGKLDIPPDHSSVGQALQVIRHAMRHWYELASGRARLELQLAGSIKDSYRRKRPKAARYRPEYKDKPSAGKPVILNATKQQRKAFQQHLKSVA